MTKEYLKQYSDLKLEEIQTRETIERLSRQIESIEKQIAKIETSGSVKDKVYGGMGGTQGFVIEGFPMAEYERKKTDLMLKKLLLNQHKSTLEVLRFDILKQTNEIEQFISSIPVSRDRMILRATVMECRTQQDIANQLYIDRSLVSKIVSKYL